MADKSQIEWCDATWNPLYGCSDASKGCTNCYAKKIAHIRKSNPNPKIAERFKGLTRLNSAGTVCWTGQINLAEDQLMVPLRWKKPRRIFVNSQSDLFHPNVPFDYVDKVFAVMALCPQHIFQILTKRPERMAEYLNDPAVQERIKQAMPEIAWLKRGPVLISRKEDWIARNSSAILHDFAWPLPNVWLGTSCEDQAAADERIPHLLNCPAAVRFLSCEPLLGDIQFFEETWVCKKCGYWLGTDDEDALEPCANCGSCYYCLGMPENKAALFCECVDDGGIDWVIAGGESGPNARPMHPDWARSLRDQCVAAGVPFFFKQVGEWDCYEHDTAHLWKSSYSGQARDSNWFPDFDALPDRERARWDTDIEETLIFEKVGKKAAGRLLDGREWNELPGGVR